MASGHVNRIKRPNTWLHRPMLQNVKKLLPNRSRPHMAPNGHGAAVTSCLYPDIIAPGGNAIFEQSPFQFSNGRDIVARNRSFRRTLREGAMRRRDFIGLIGGAVAAWPRAARTQQSLPVIGFLHQGSLPPPPLTAIFRKGLVEAGVVEGQSIRIEQRAADGQYDRLPALAADLVNRQVTVIAADFLPAALAAKAATQTIPIVFLSGSDPIGSGLVSSINRPTANVTGIAFMFTRLGAKRLELLRELIPDVTSVAALINPTNPNSGPQLKDLQTAAHDLGLQLISVGASNEQEIESVFSTLAQNQIGALVISADGFLVSRQDQLVALAARHAIPTMYPWRQYADAGELIVYGANLPDGFRQCGIYVGKVLKGSGPTDLPVLQPSTYEFVINLKTAKALGLKVPPTLIAIANEVIE
jgi:putative tryptophan/tyrosine transport system substrate-binding protein